MLVSTETKENRTNVKKLWQENLQDLAAEQMDIGVYGQGNGKGASTMTQLIPHLRDQKNGGARNTADVMGLGGR